MLERIRLSEMTNAVQIEHGAAVFAMWCCAHRILLVGPGLSLVPIVSSLNAEHNLLTASLILLTDSTQILVGPFIDTVDTAKWHCMQYSWHIVLVTRLTLQTAKRTSELDRDNHSPTTFHKRSGLPQFPEP